MIVKDLESIINSPITLTSGNKRSEYQSFAELPDSTTKQVVTKIQAQGDRIVLETREPQSTQALEANDYQFEVGF
ncbi:MAG: hypothetical protein Q8M16_17440 [Pirellulaceae bacterium]|nr:hypothetical protein [Pirellulaceae bacterium]